MSEEESSDREGGRTQPEPDSQKGAKENAGQAVDEAGLRRVLEMMYHGSAEYDDETVDNLFRRLRGPIEGLRFGDRSSLRDHLVLLHAPLVEHCARNFRSSNEPLDDLVQEGYVGLIKAVDRFDPDKGVRFSTYAYHLIVGEMRHYLRDLGRLIHEPGWHFELRQRITRTSDQLTQKMGRPPKPEEIGEALNISADQVRDVLRNQQTLTIERLDNSNDDNENGPTDNEQKLTDEGSVPDITETHVDNQLMLGTAIPKLRDLEKRVVTMFFFEDCTKTEIARRLDISVNYAAYLIKRGLENLRQIIETSDAATALPSQQQARAAYLLSQARDAAKNGSKRSKKAAEAKAAASTLERREPESKELPVVPAMPRTNIASFAEWSAWVDEEVQRAGRYKQEFCVLWLQIANWTEVAESLEVADVRRVSTAIRALVRRVCRSMDKIAVLSDTTLPGLHFMIMMPHTGGEGRIVGERWVEQCRPADLRLPESSGVEHFQTQFAISVFPGDGKTTEDLFRALGTQIQAGQYQEVAGSRRG